MSRSSCLLKARALVAKGWSPYLPRTADGRVTTPDDPLAIQFDVYSAIAVSATDTAEYLSVLELLEEQACPNAAALNRLAGGIAADRVQVTESTAAAVAQAATLHPMSLSSWLETSGRPQSHVLSLFDLALLRAKSLEAPCE